MEVMEQTMADGPGLRTTFFVKGCPLRCIWCHNPESIDPKPQEARFQHLCRHCAHCTHDEATCPTRAFKLYGRPWTQDALVAKALEGADYTWGWVPYTDPGANLTFAIRDELRRVEEKTGKVPSVILMQNHGIIVHDDDAERCLAIHADANERLAQQFGVHGDSFPAISVRQTGEELYEADTPYLREALKNCRYDYKTFIETPLYPDQMVFLIGTFFMDKEGTPAEGECYADTRTGALVLHMGEKKAKTITETLTAVIFIMDTVAKMGYTVSTMGEAAKSFIANWESEKYRKSLAGKKG